jgi:hypothetical protein
LSARRSERELPSSSSSSSISRFEDEDRYAEDEDDYDVSTLFSRPQGISVIIDQVPLITMVGCVVMMLLDVALR